MQKLYSGLHKSTPVMQNRNRSCCSALISHYMEMWEERLWLALPSTYNVWAMIRPETQHTISSAVLHLVWQSLAEKAEVCVFACVCVWECAGFSKRLICPASVIFLGYYPERGSYPPKCAVSRDLTCVSHHAYTFKTWICELILTNAD